MSQVQLGLLVPQVRPLLLEALAQLVKPARRAQSERLATVEPRGLLDQIQTQLDLPEPLEQQVQVVAAVQEVPLVVLDRLDRLVRPVQLAIKGRKVRTAFKARLALAAAAIRR